MSSAFFTPAITSTFGVGLVISVVYLAVMRLALLRAVQTRDRPEDDRPDAFKRSFAGALFAVAASSAAIAAFGVGASWLYLGPVLALVSPAAVAYTLYRESRD